MRAYYLTVVVLILGVCDGFNVVDRVKRDSEISKCLSTPSQPLDLTKIAGSWYIQQQIVLIPSSSTTNTDLRKEICAKVTYFDTEPTMAKILSQTFVNTTTTSKQFPEYEGSVNITVNGTYDTEIHIKGTSISTTEPGVMLSADPKKFMLFLSCLHDDPDVPKIMSVVTQRELPEEEVKTLWEEAAVKLERDFSKMNPLKYGFFC